MFQVKVLPSSLSDRVSYRLNSVFMAYKLQLIIYKWSRNRVNSRRKLSSSMSGRESIVGTSPCDSVRWKHVLRGRLRGVECPKRVRTVPFISTDADRNRVTLVRRKLEQESFFIKTNCLPLGNLLKSLPFSIILLVFSGIQPNARF